MDSVKGATQFTWPKGLTLWDLRRIIWGRWMQRMPEVLSGFAKDGKPRITLEQAFQIAQEIETVSNEWGFFVLDPDEHPEQFRPPDLPACVLETHDDVYFEPQKMQEIVDLYQGKTLPEGLSDDAYYGQLQQLRRRLVATRPCRQPGCKNRVVITVSVAAQAIIGHKLLETGLLYEPSTLCKKCHEMREIDLVQRRTHPGVQRNKRVSRAQGTPIKIGCSENETDLEKKEKPHGDCSFITTTVNPGAPKAEA